MSNFHLPGRDLECLKHRDLIRIYKNRTDLRNNIAALIIWQRKDRKLGNISAANEVQKRIDDMRFGLPVELRW